MARKIMRGVWEDGKTKEKIVKGKKRERRRKKNRWRKYENMEDEEMRGDEMIKIGEKKTE